MKFTKKPVTIDAVQWSKDGDHPNVVELPKKVRDTIDERTTALGVDALRWIGTLEGGHIVSAGDWIITGVQGEQYPCKPDIFEMTYSPADTTQDPRDEELARLREQLEVERMRLVACGVVAMANTPESAAINRQMKDEYRSGSLDDVIRIVDSEMALREQVLAQQARIVELRDALEQSALDSATHGVTCGAVTILRAKALATPDDTAALKAHDDALWGKALTRGIEWQATRGHTLDADDYENELRSLKR